MASLRSLAKLGKRPGALTIAPEKLVPKIDAKAWASNSGSAPCYQNELLPALQRHGIRIRGVDDLNAKQLKAVQRHYAEAVMPLLHTAAVRPGNAPFIEGPQTVPGLPDPATGKRARLVLLNVPATPSAGSCLPSAKGRTTSSSWTV